MSKKWQNTLVIAFLAVSITLILWLTLFSRIGSYAPFLSYKAVFCGSGTAILEIVGNIVLFIPVGVMLAMFFRIDLKRGFTLSLNIESCQWFFCIGSFEIDDLLHNTIGTGMGSLLIARTSMGNKFDLGNRKKSVTAFLVLTTIIIVSGLDYHDLQWREMSRLTALNDRNGNRNLLVLCHKPSYMRECDVNVTYNSDGNILIEGSSENRVWIQIGLIELMPSKYVITGLSDTNENTINLVLDTYNPEEGRKRRITQEVGAITESEFVVEKENVVRALINNYPRNEHSVIERSAVFQAK